jgi:hypothetical protein
VVELMEEIERELHAEEEENEEEKLLLLLFGVGELAVVAEDGRSWNLSIFVYYSFGMKY